MKPIKFNELVSGEWYWEGGEIDGVWRCWFFKGENEPISHAWEQTIYWDDEHHWDDKTFYGPIPKPTP